MCKLSTAMQLGLLLWIIYVTRLSWWLWYLLLSCARLSIVIKRESSWFFPGKIWLLMRAWVGGWIFQLFDHFVQHLIVAHAALHYAHAKFQKTYDQLWCHWPFVIWLHNISLLPVSIFCLLSFNFFSMIFHIHFYPLSSGFCSHFSLLLAYFHIPYSISMLLCSVSILSLHHLSIIPHLPSPSLTTQHFVPCDSASHILHSPYYPIHCITLSPVV